MERFLDINYKSINKYGEELCGDNVEFINSDNGCIIVLSDGLGSGVKANILATMTTKIAVTMLENDATIDDTIDTIINTLPECKIRKLAYSTFTIIKIDNDYNAYIAEYDNPPYFYYSNKKSMPIEKRERIIDSRKIYESNIQLKLGDTLSIVSDGAIHAGIGQMLNLGWSWDEINNYLEDLNNVNRSAQLINGNFIGVCNNLYNNKPGDDTTILTIKVRMPEILDIFIGPPADKQSDAILGQIMKSSENMKIICGGTTALIAERELGKELQVDLDSIKDDVPPLAYMEGFNLITEGVLTLGKTLENIKKCNKTNFEDLVDFDDYDGCSLLTKFLTEISTHINFYIGHAVNPAHQNPNFPTSFNIKQKIVDDLIKELKKTGKKITTTYL
ncbi:SpoIIE family protein phosphatase [Sedimentibacter sp. MB31-C6]|uniref:SpoIIE family protein phosphatase n=1 Tax=Sedimentibacter sp. MB31-C6 TaxID=3109366 RepID=UPI002DDD0535|nr:SpoIIE family protein phosphatase [Sedimentibacter sp. MB36-C1]WSI05279.1 SpoIIE family protein phosphatase [Sedimentibacter sp. MB36-C1]